MKFFIAFLAITGFTAISAHADIYLEPYAAVEIGHSGHDSTLNVPAATPPNVLLDSSTGTHGMAYGGKLGVEYLGVALGGDYMASSVTMFGSGNDTVTNIGAFAQVTMPLFLKVMATYFFSSKDKGSLYTATGGGFKAGVGFLMIPFISLNVEYLNLSYSKGTSTNDKATYSSFKQNTGALLVGFSVPISI